MKDEPDPDLALALIILRVVRGWRQDDLSKASRIPSSSISDYERGKKMPEARTVGRLLDAMGYTSGALHRAQRFMNTIRAEKVLTLVDERAAAKLSEGLVDPNARSAAAALQWELDQISAEAGLVTARLTRAVLVLMTRAGGPLPEVEMMKGKPSS